MTAVGNLLTFMVKPYHSTTLSLCPFFLLLEDKSSLVNPTSIKLTVTFFFLRGWRVKLDWPKASSWPCLLTIVYFAVGVDALKFLNLPPQVSSGYLAMNFDFNCSTDDANATVKLFFAADFVNYNERTLSPEKLHLNKQVFTLLNLGVRDGGQYRCKATDGKENIEWPSTHGLLFLSQGRWNTSIQYVQCSLHYVLFSKSNPHC